MSAFVPIFGMLIPITFFVLVAIIVWIGSRTRVKVAALQANTGAENGSAISSIVSHFGDIIWSTFAGLAAAILLMFINSILETTFLGLVENRQHVRDTVVRAKRELALAEGSAAKS